MPGEEAQRIKFAETLADHEARLKMLERTYDAILQMNENVAVIANQTANQGRQLEVLVSTLKDHEIEIKDIRESVRHEDSLRESIKRVWESIEDINQKNAKITKEITDEQNKEAKAVYENWKKLKWLLISGSIGLSFSIVGTIILLAINLR